VNVIGHQHIGMQGAGLRFKGFAQPAEIKVPVGIVEEDGAAIVSPLDNVVCLAGAKRRGRRGMASSNRWSGLMLPDRKILGNGAVRGCRNVH